MSTLQSIWGKGVSLDVSMLVKVLEGESSSAAIGTRLCFIILKLSYIKINANFDLGASGLGIDEGICHCSNKSQCGICEIRRSSLGNGRAVSDMQVPVDTL